MNFLIAKAFAQYQPGSVSVPGIRASFGQVMTAVVNFLGAAAFAVCTAIFFVGAFWMVAYAAKPEEAAKGKDIMIDALKGYVVIIGAYAILKTVFYLLTGN